MLPGAGTQERDRYDREAVEALLAVTSEPWKEKMENWAEKRRAACLQCQAERFAMLSI